MLWSTTFFGILLEDKLGCSYNNSFGGKMNSIISVLTSYLAFTKRNGVLENTLAGPSVTAGKTSLSWRRILLVLLAMLQSLIPSLSHYCMIAWHWSRQSRREHKNSCNSLQRVKRLWEISEYTNMYKIQSSIDKYVFCFRQSTVR